MRWGNAPRSLLYFIAQEDWEVETLYRRAAPQALAQCSRMLASGVELDIGIELPYLFYFIRPMRTSTGCINHKVADMSVPTAPLCHILAETRHSFAHRSPEPVAPELVHTVSNGSYITTCVRNIIVNCIV